MKTKRGFTVLEVMIAIAIFVGAAIVLGGAYLGIMNAYAQIDTGGDFKNDVMFARSAILSEPDMETIEKGGEFDAANAHHVSWKATIEPTDIADLFNVTFECEINGADLPQVVHITEQFRALRPTWSKPDDRERLRTAARDRIQKLQTTQGGSQPSKP
ncbi:MAG: prepilin-type N-terminal cleavage/methylation domain-containing protein [Nibricoccus sp.]